MKSVPNKCIKKHRTVEVTIEEQLSAVIFSNPDHLEILEYLVDGCIFLKKDGERCDSLVVVNEKDLSLFIELKGSDIDKAFGQLATTQEDLDELRRGRNVWIISYSGRPCHTSSIQNMLYRARQTYNARLEVKATPYTYQL